MTTELTKAAQQALEALDALIADPGEDRIRTRIWNQARASSDALHTALTQRPAAQTEREAFEAEMRCEETWGHRSLKKRPDGRYQNWQVDVMWDVWQARASLPASQQATPEPLGEPFGYFRALPFGWEQCGEHDDGAVALYTRPASGVPEGWRNVIAGTLKTDPWDSARVADYNSGWNDCQRKTLIGLERLAAAQAKGGQ